MEEAERKKIPVLLMFPGPGALDVKDVAERGIPRSAVEGVIDESGGGKESNDEETTAEAGAEAPPLAFGPVRGGEYILVVVDGTWHQGKQMFRVSWFPRVDFFFFYFFLLLLQKEKTRPRRSSFFSSLALKK